MVGDFAAVEAILVVEGSKDNFVSFSSFSAAETLGLCICTSISRL